MVIAHKYGYHDTLKISPDEKKKDSGVGGNR